MSRNYQVHPKHTVLLASLNDVACLDKDLVVSRNIFVEYRTLHANLRAQ